MSKHLGSAALLHHPASLNEVVENGRAQSALGVGKHAGGRGRDPRAMPLIQLRPMGRVVTSRSGRVAVDAWRVLEEHEAGVTMGVDHLLAGNRAAPAPHAVCVEGVVTVGDRRVEGAHVLVY